jgi:uncharacterized protein YggE
MAEGGFLGLLAFIALIGLILVASLKTLGPFNLSPQQELLTVSGTSQADVAPDEAILTLQVVSRGDNATSVSNENKQGLSDVMAALTGQGLPAGAVETTGLLLDRWTEWDPKSQTMVEKGYEQTTTLKVTVTDIASVGSILDAAVNAGANSVQEIVFQLRPETEQKLKETALKEATTVAKAKAQVLADASGAKLGKIASLTETSEVRPWYYTPKAAAAETTAPTPISPEKVTVTANVNLAYELK